jgi:alkanesulfonate monooxygenase SsuD/methylene tetrahydromethanopterin reductase-like flavin-dependent oxidoreductase (luciferase family)
MQFGLSLPSAGAAASGHNLIRFAQRAESLGFESLWCGDNFVLPTAGTNQYPYTADGSFPRSSDVGFLETFTVLSYVAAVTRRIRLGTTVLVLPYRNPVVQAKMMASKHPEFRGRYCQFDAIQFNPKPVQQPLPVWVGGHSKRAIRRAAAYGQAWHPTRQTPAYVAEHLPYLREQAERAGRDPGSIIVSLKRSLHITDIGLPESDAFRSGNAVVGSTREVIDDARRCQDIGIQQLTYDFRSDDIEAQIAIMERLVERVVPVLRHESPLQN